jgi:hypothetical protein
MFSMVSSISKPFGTVVAKMVSTKSAEAGFTSSKTKK